MTERTLQAFIDAIVTAKKRMHPRRGGMSWFREAVKFQTSHSTTQSKRMIEDAELKDLQLLAAKMILNSGSSKPEA